MVPSVFYPSQAFGGCPQAALALRGGYGLTPEGINVYGTIGTMKISVRLFASYREAIGTAVVQVALEEGSRAQAVWTTLVSRFPALAALPEPSGYAVNDEYVDGARTLWESDEVALIPPVSGGAGGRMPLVELTDGPISVDRVLHEVADPAAGAIVVFLGVVRDNARGRRVDHLMYEAYETLARREMEKVASAIGERWQVTRVVMVHRTGILRVGEASVVIAVSAPHRGAAFEAGRFAIDTLKRTVPVWKKEVWEGGEAWVGADSRKG